jgi:hypothetical protein
MPETLKKEEISYVRKQIKKLKGFFWDSSDEFTNKSLEWFANNDPSEGINSQNIIPILKNTFDEIDIREFGGTLLHFNSAFYENFNYSNPEHRDFLEFAFDFETSLINSGIIKSDNVHVICRKN